MVVFLTDDFHESDWCNQEVGYALGRHVPILTTKLEDSDPRGFISNKQAMRGSIEDIDETASALSKLILAELDVNGRAKEVLISAFINSTDFNQTKTRFEELRTAATDLSEKDVSLIIDGFRMNDQLYKAGHLISKYQRLKNYLNDAAGGKFSIEGREITWSKDK